MMQLQVKYRIQAMLLFLLAAIRILASDPPPIIPDGDRFRMSIDRDGIYQISYSELISMGIADPANVRIYGRGGAMLPEKADRSSIGSLREIPVWVNTGSDGVFGNGDYILFYGQGTAVWRYHRQEQEFRHELHLWANESSYLIVAAPGGKRIETEISPAGTFAHDVTAFDEHLFYEQEQMNLLRSGRYWYGEDFRSAKTHRVSFSLPDADESGNAHMDVRFMAQTPSDAAQLQVKCNGTEVASKQLPVVANYEMATETVFRTATFLATNSVQVELNLNNNGVAGAGGWLDWLRIFYRRKLNMQQKQLFFRDTRSVGVGQTARFSVGGSNAGTQVWDITDMHNIRRIDAQLTGNMLTFTAATDSLREFVAFDIAAGLMKPKFHGKLDHRNLRGMDRADMIVVAHPDFMDAARSLAALHRERDGIVVETVTDAEVYGEFSSGMQDPAAIRNFMKYIYETPQAPQLKYLLLLGDGSYDNREIRMASAGRIVTYQSENSWHTINSYVSDDYFGILGDEEAVESGKLAIGVGRIPVQTAEQAADAVAKIRRYMDSQQTGDWPNTIGLLADDGDGNLHTIQSEVLADDVSSTHPQYTVEKIYFDAYPRIATADGHRYPEAEQQLSSLMSGGCLTVNYIGHGNASGLAEERVVNTTNIQQWSNRLYPLFVAATCEFGRYDNDATVTAAEHLLRLPGGGSIAVLTSTRLVYSSLNFQFNQSFFRELLTRHSGIDHRLGDVVRRAKNMAGASVNKLCFTLLGDPALELPIPTDSVRTLAINGIVTDEPQDTLRAHSHVTIRGCITGTDGQIRSDFSGIVHITLFDKERERQTLNNSGELTPITFQTRTSALFMGKTDVNAGIFELTFTMPRDMDYRYGAGKISYYARADNKRIAAGAFEDITVGGSAPATISVQGPQIRLFMNDTLFRSGGITDQNPQLIARLHDDTGINTSDAGIGHQITAVLSSAPSTVYNLNRHYEADLGNPNRGTVSYRFSGLPAGDHELLLTAWNLLNIPTQANIRFRVTPRNTLHIARLYNYPNPFAESTKIYFEFNMPEAPIEVELQIFDLSGRLLRTIRQTLISAGFTSGAFEWDARNAGGNRVKAGVYIYRVILNTANGQSAWQASKMVVGN